LARTTTMATSGNKTAGDALGSAPDPGLKAELETPDAWVAVPDEVVFEVGVDEKILVRKLDLHLIPLIMALYIFSFLDR
jgi:hypothetical protein